jgi:hypothetical protein
LFLICRFCGKQLQNRSVATARKRVNSDLQNRSAATVAHEKKGAVKVLTLLRTVAALLFCTSIKISLDPSPISDI